MTTTRSSTFWTLATLVVVGTLICNTNNVSAQCGGSIPALISECSKFVQKSGPKIPPSPSCCAVIRNFNIPCACKLITKDAERFVSIPKAIFVARSCGLKLPPGMQCGSIVVPPKAM